MRKTLLRFIIFITCMNAFAQGYWFERELNNYPRFYGPTGIDLDASGSNMYVVDGERHSILKISTSSGQLLAKWGGQGGYDSELYGPTDVAVDSDGNVYVTDTYNNRIQKFSSTGTFIRVIGNVGNAPGEFINPAGIDVDASNNLYITDITNSRVVKLNSNGDFISQWGSEGAGDGEFNAPIDIAIDNNGNIFVSDQGNHRIQKFDAAGTFITKWGYEGGGQDGFDTPWGLAVHPNGNVYIADRMHDRFKVYSNSGSYITELSQVNPHGIAINNAGELFIPDPNNDRVWKRDQSGNTLESWGNSTNGYGILNQPAGIEEYAGKIFVADKENNRTQKFSQAGEYMEWYMGVMLVPSGVAADADGMIYVSDVYNHRILKRDEYGNYYPGWGTYGTGNGEFDTPTSVAVDSDRNVYVVDFRNHRIQKFNSSGIFMTSWGTQGSGNGEFSYPYGIAIDASNNVFVMDSYNHRVQKFNSNGDFILKWGTQGSDPGQFYYASGLTTDATGNVYVADGMNNRIQKFNNTGDFILQLGSIGFSNYKFNGPADVAVDASGNLYVSDMYNNRIMKYKPLLQPVSNTAICDGQSVLLSSTASHGNQWYFNGDPIVGATAQTYDATQAGNYYVVARDITSEGVTLTTISNPVPTITPGGTTNICDGNSVTLTSSSASGNQWYRNGNLIGGATNATYAANAGGNYTVTTINGACTSNPSIAKLVMIISRRTTPTITAGGPVSFCDGGTVTLTSSAATSNQWYVDGNEIMGGTNQTLVADATGNYTVVHTGNMAATAICNSLPSAAVVLNEYPYPATPGIDVDGATEFCEDSYASLISTSTSGNQWYMNGDPINGETTQFLQPAVAGSFTVIKTENGCSSSQSAAVTTTVKLLPDATVTLNGGTITATAATASYQWLDCNNNNDFINAATLQNFTPAANGNYAVKITENGCEVISSCVNVIVSGTDDAHESTRVSLYPNPNNGTFYLHSSVNGTSIEIVNAQGVTIYSAQLSETKSEINLEEQVQGIYFYKLSANNGIVKTGTIVIE